MKACHSTIHDCNYILIRYKSCLVSHEIFFQIALRHCVYCTYVMMACDWQEERLRRGDDLRLQMAIEESKREKTKPEEVCNLFVWGNMDVYSSIKATQPKVLFLSASTFIPRAITTFLVIYWLGKQRVMWMNIASQIKTSGFRLQKLLVMI